MVGKPKEKKLTLTKATTLEYERQLWQARFSPCGEFLIGCGYDATIQRWRLTKEKPQSLQEFNGHHGWVQCLGYRREGKLLFTADSWGRLAAWRYDSDKSAARWQHESAHDGWIRALTVTPDQNSVLTAGNDRVVRKWDAATGKLQKQFNTFAHRIFSLVVHPQNKWFYAGDLQGDIYQCDLATGKVQRKLDAGKLAQLHRIQECGGARTLALNLQGDRLVCAGQQDSKGGFAGGTPAAIVFDTASGKVVNQIKVGSSTDGFVYDVQFHPDGYVMATASAFPGKGHLWFWRPDEQKPFHEETRLTNGRSISLHPDGKQLAYLVSNSPNRNGRQLKDGKYVGGSAKIHLLTM